jgi:hypothetical protein
MMQVLSASALQDCVRLNGFYFAGVAYGAVFLPWSLYFYDPSNAIAVAQLVSG